MVKKKDIKGVESKVLKTFKKELPSVHFSDKTKEDYEEWTLKLTNLFHNLLNFPPKMFEGCSLIDFGAGTGENSVQFTNWGATCTLVDANDQACIIAKGVFDKYSRAPEQHNVVCSSLFKFETKEKFDIVFTNGVIHHTDDKEGAFNKIAGFLKPGGYFILGIGNKPGGFQNMLQRMIIFNFAKTDEEMVVVAEKLFQEDIDRSVGFSNRSRRSMIFDRFVVPKQDDPTVFEVLEWFKENNFNLYSSYPRFLPSVFADSDLKPPSFDLFEFMEIGAFSEAFWMVNQEEDAEEIPKICESFSDLARTQHDLSDYVNDFNLEDKIDHKQMLSFINNYQKAMQSTDPSSYIKAKHVQFFKEVKTVLDILEDNDLELLGQYLKKTKHLFRGANGLRHMYYIGHKVF